MHNRNLPVANQEDGLFAQTALPIANVFSVISIVDSCTAFAAGVRLFYRNKRVTGFGRFLFEVLRYYKGWL
jgi:hypothetical protein